MFGIGNLIPPAGWKPPSDHDEALATARRLGHLAEEVMHAHGLAPEAPRSLEETDQIVTFLRKGEATIQACVQEMD